MRGFYIGRYQPFHNGHRHMVEEIAAEVDESSCWGSVRPATPTPPGTRSRPESAS